MDKMPNIYFEWENGLYFIPPETRAELRRIILPDGQVLEFSGTALGLPPEPIGLRALCFTVTPRFDATLERIAIHLGAAIATRIAKVKYVRKCPNGHLKQTDIYCSKCGSRLELTEVITPYKPPKS